MHEGGEGGSPKGFKLNTEFVLQAATFLGEERHFEQPWSLPSEPAKPRFAPKPSPESEAVKVRSEYPGRGRVTTGAPTAIAEVLNGRAELGQSEADAGLRIRTGKRGEPRPRRARMARGPRGGTRRTELPNVPVGYRPEARPKAGTASPCSSVLTLPHRTAGDWRSGDVAIPRRKRGSEVEERASPPQRQQASSSRSGCRARQPRVRDTQRGR